MDVPDSIEGVALALFMYISQMVGASGAILNAPPEARALDLFGECLRAVKGDRWERSLRH